MAKFSKLLLITLLYLKAEDKDGKIDVSVGGKVVMVAKGQLI
ncbi:MAG: hypothetical protein ACYTFW_19305 [Planctomycetota bacterium]|jgi:hypothetical protein